MGIDTDKIKRLREKKGLTQEQAAINAGFSTKQYWNQLETGKRSNINIVTLEKVAKAIGAKAKDLLK